MTEESCPPRPHSDGFTLIEVIAALVIFSVGVLMVISLSGGLSEQMKRAAISSELVVLAHARLDSLESLDFDSLAVGTTTDSVSVRGVSYTRRVDITQVTGLLLQIGVTLTPQSGGAGPSYTASSYQAATW